MYQTQLPEYDFCTVPKPEFSVVDVQLLQKRTGISADILESCICDRNILRRVSLTFVRKILQSSDTGERVRLLQLLQNMKKVVVDYHLTVTSQVHVLRA